MFASVIVPTYKDVRALELILEALERQTYRGFEVVIAEDAEEFEVKDFLEKQPFKLKIRHVSHPDKGNRKAVVLNKALRIAEGEYIIFIDGDTIPFSTFVHSHVVLSEPRTVLCGRRVNLGEAVSNDIRNQRVSVQEIEQHFLRRFFYLYRGGTKHYEQGLRLLPMKMANRIVNFFDDNIHILGSNFSCYKEDIFAINGFDEAIVGGSKDDVDLEWRFIDSGCRLKSCKYSANLFHLDHTRNDRFHEEAIAKKQMEANRSTGKYVSEHGISQHG